MKRKRIGFICAVLIPVILLCAAACAVKGVQDMKIIEDKKDIVIYHIPQNFECGSYSLSELKPTGEQYVDLTLDQTPSYEDYGGMGRLSYSEYHTYLFTREQVDNTLKAVYSEDGHIEKITVKDEDNNAEIPVYIFFPDTEAVKEAIKEPALKISESFSKQILSVKEPISRIFLIISMTEVPLILIPLQLPTNSGGQRKRNILNFLTLPIIREIFKNTLLKEWAKNVVTSAIF